jgi:hypothetical protein
MPRDLTDLMERATSSAPPEPHLAADITRLAARRQRRRTTNLAIGSTLAVVVAGVLGYGVTRGHPSTPEPAAPEPPVTYRYGQHQTLSDAVSSSGDPDFRTLDYGLPSVIPGQGSMRAMGRYHSIDAEGRLIVLDAKYSSPLVGSFSYQLAEGPDGPVREIPQPPLELMNKIGHDLQWDVEPTGDGRLLWHAAGTDFDAEDGILAELTDLDGSQLRSLGADISQIPIHTATGIPTVSQLWVDGDAAYASVQTRDNGSLKSPVQLDTLYTYPLSDHADVTPASAHDVLGIDQSHGTAVWVNADATRVYAEDLSTGAQHVVPVPIDKGCQIPSPQSFFGGVNALLRTNGDLVALTEYCGRTARIVVTDLTGRLVTEVDPGPKGALYAMALGERTLTFGSVNGRARWYADDLETGSVVALGQGNYQDVNNLPSSAGDYVLWYDSTGGHVGEFTD